MEILVRNESSDPKESFKHVLAGRVSSVSSPFSKIAKQLKGKYSGQETSFLPYGIKAKILFLPGFSRCFW